MTEWLDVMLAEIARKQREADEARAEQQRREREAQEPAAPPDDQSK